MKIKPIEVWAQTYRGRLTGTVIYDDRPRPIEYADYKWCRANIVPMADTETPKRKKAGKR